MARVVAWPTILLQGVLTYELCKCNPLFTLIKNCTQHLPWQIEAEFLEEPAEGVTVSRGPEAAQTVITSYFGTTSFGKRKRKQNLFHFLQFFLH